MSELYLFFSGEMNPVNTRFITGALSAATQKDPAINHIHFLFQSFGGEFTEGIFLHNFLSGYSQNMTLYGGGFVASAGAVAFVGATRRAASPKSSYMFHGVRTGFNPGDRATVQELRDFANRASAQEKIINGILYGLQPGLPVDEWNKRIAGELYFSAEQALETGIVHAIDSFSVPKGLPLFDVTKM